MTLQLTSIVRALISKRLSQTVFMLTAWAMVMSLAVMATAIVAVGLSNLLVGQTINPLQILLRWMVAH